MSTRRLPKVRLGEHSLAPQEDAAPLRPAWSRGIPAATRACIGGVTIDAR